MSQPSERMVLLAEVCKTRWGMSDENASQLLNLINTEWEKGYNRGMDDAIHLCNTVKAAIPDPSFNYFMDSLIRKFNEFKE